MKIFISLLIAIATPLLGQAQPQVTPYNDLAAFQAASTTTIQATFDSLPPATGIPSPLIQGSVVLNVLPGARPFQVEPPGDDLVSLAPHTSNVLVQNGNEDFDMTFSGLPPTAVGFDTYTNAFGPPIVTVFDTNTILIGTFALVQPPQTLGFFGVTSSVPIGRIHWLADRGGLLDTGIDTIRVGTSSSLSAPTKLKATQLGFNGTLILLSWNYGSDPVDGFSFQSKIPSKGDGPNSWSSPTNVSFASACSASASGGSAFTCTYIDTNVPAFITKSYRVNAYSGSNTSDSTTATAYQLKECGLAPLPSGQSPLRTDCNTFSSSKAVIQADFTPDSTMASVSAAAKALPPDVPQNKKFDHFNWLQYIEHWPKCYLNDPQHQLHAAVPNPNNLLGDPSPGDPINQVGQVDGALGGYYEYYAEATFLNGDAMPKPGFGLDDQLPFYWNEQQQWYLNPIYSLNSYADNGLSWPHRGRDIGGAKAGRDQNQQKTASFYDNPKMNCSVDSDDYLQFLTYLVGVRTPVGVVPPDYDVLNGFVWFSNYYKRTGGVYLSNIDPPSSGGSGGVFNVANVDVTNLPPNLRQQLIQAGASGVSTAPYVDKSAPMTTNLLSGPEGTNGWYTGPVTVTLIATDIDGPSDIAVTSYRIDGGLTNNYSGPVLVSSDGTHNIQFGSVDRAGNVEAASPTIGIKIDATPPCHFRHASCWLHTLAAQSKTGNGCNHHRSECAVRSCSRFSQCYGHEQ